MDSFFIPIILTSVFAGISIGLLGVQIVGMRMPFIGSCISHTAMVGAVYASLAGIDPTLGALAFSVLGSGAAAMIPPGRRGLDANTGQAVLLSFMMGLVFLAVGLQQDGRAEILSLLWGNVLFANWGTVAVTGSLTVVLAAFVTVFDKELKSVLFSRVMASVSDRRSGLVYAGFLCLSGLILAVHLQAVGGLLLFSLLVCPAAGAYQVCRGYTAVAMVSMAFGLLSTTLGFSASYFFNIPTGACIVITSSLIFGLCSFVSAVRQTD